MSKSKIPTHSFASLSRTMQARLIKLHQKLLAIWRDPNPNKRFPNATELGEFLEVTPRTVYRFIEIMQVDAANRLA
jgi:hypothetical protein